MPKVLASLWRFLPSSVALAAGMTGAAFAQTGGTNEAGVGEIVVTAQRFEQTVRDVPVSIAAISGEQLDNLGIDDLKDVTGQVPNLFINNFNGRSDTVRLFIRGIGQNDVSLTQDPSVALYIDNVYVGSAIGSSFDSMELERVEILRGPQGTLYGRNSTGGAVNLIPRRPVLEEFNGSASLTTGTFNLEAGRIGVNVPVGDTFAAKFDYGRTTRDGWVENEGPGEDFSTQDRENVRGALRWMPIGNFVVDYAYDWSHVQDAQPFTTATSFAPSPRPDGYYSLPSAPPIVGVGVTFNDPQVSAARPDTATSIRPVLPGESQISGHALNLSWDISPTFTLRSVTGFRRISSVFQGDYFPTAEGTIFFTGTTTPVPEFIGGGTGSVGGQHITTHFSNFSQELQALGTANFGVGELRYVTGVYYYTQEGSQAQESIFAVPRGQASAEIDDQSWAAFGEGTFTPRAFNQRLHLTLGARYSEDSRSAIRFNEGSVPYARLGGLTPANCANLSLSFNPGECPAPPGGVVQAATYDKDFDNFTLSSSATWELTEDINVYARVAEGYKTGGTSERSADPVLFSQGYQPEEIISYEVGVKGLYFDNRVALNVSAFYMTLDAFQTSVQTGATPGERDFVGLDGNTYNGLEADATWRVTDHLTLNSSVGLLTTEVGQPTVSFELAPGGVCTGTLVGALCTQRLITEFPYAPDRTVTIGMNYDRPLAGNVSISSALNYAFQSSSQTSLNVFENTSIDARGVLDGNFTVRFADVGSLDEVSLRLWGRNILDEDYRVVDNGSFATLIGAAQQAEWGEPRTVGLTLEARY